jgi:hypothetical protein
MDAGVGKELMYGSREKLIRANGKMIRWMEEVYLLLLMGILLKANLETILKFEQNVVL